MRSDLMKLFALQRQLFGVCPCCGAIFRLSDCRVYQKRRPVADWFDRLKAAEDRIDRAESRWEEEIEPIRDAAQQVGRRKALAAVRKIDPVCTPRRLSPSDAKVIFHPVDYVVFKGMNTGNSIKSVVLLDRKNKGRQDRIVQRSIERAVNRGLYDWITFRVNTAGEVSRD